MITKVVFFIHKHWEDFFPGLIGGGSFTVLLTSIDIIMKILVAAATLIYFYFKIRNERRKK